MYDITTFAINGVTPFHSPADAVDEQLGQAHALLVMLGGANDVCDRIEPHEADGFTTIRPGIAGRALDGIATLVALAQYHLDASRERPFNPQTTREAEAEIAQDWGKWAALVSAYQSAKAPLDEHSATPDNSSFGTQENESYEAKTEELAIAHADAFDAIMLHPAPHPDRASHPEAVTKRS